MEPDYLTGVHDPFLFDDMSRAVDRIIQARFGAERITIYGDYDVDGLSSSALLFDFLSLIGCDVGTHINHRERDGYGLNATAINSIIESGTRLIITTDGGISNAAEIAIAQGRNVDVIITDHHTVPKDPANIPNAFAILHPLVRADRYPFKELSGGGVAFKFVQALVKYSGNKEFSDLKTSVRNPDGSPINWEGYEKWLFGLGVLVDNRRLCTASRREPHFCEVWTTRAFQNATHRPPKASRYLGTDEQKSHGAYGWVRDRPAFECRKQNGPCTARV